MRLFTVNTVETRRRAWTVAARDAHAAERAVRARLPRGARITERPVPVEDIDTTASGEAALAQLLGTPYLPRDGAPMMIEDWVLLALGNDEGPGRDAVNTRLAPAGLRVADDCLWIGSAACIPAMGLIFEGTEWAGRGLADALRLLPGARTRHMTYAGRRARSIGLPLAQVFAVQPVAEARA